MSGGEGGGSDGRDGATAAPPANEGEETMCVDGGENRDRDESGIGEVLLYHEPQVSRLCGVHCLNTLLQGPYFTEVDLAAMAEELDRREREVMMESGMESQEYLRFIAEGSGNVAADGDFSIQVLEKALGVWGMCCLPLDMAEAIDARRDPQAEQAFICNLQSHWFTIRKVNGEWYNFNSLFPAPEHLSQFYLNAYLSSLQQSGWTIFVVRGEIPKEMGREGGGHDELSGSYGRWLDPSEAARLMKENKRMRDEARRAPVGNDLQLAAAIKASMEESNRQEERVREMERIDDEDDEMDADLEAAIAASLEEARPPAISTSAVASSSLGAVRGGTTGGGVSGGELSRDPVEIARALAESYQAMVNARGSSGIAASSGSRLNPPSRELIDTTTTTTITTAATSTSTTATSTSTTASASLSISAAACSSLSLRSDRGGGGMDEGGERTAGGTGGAALAGSGSSVAGGGGGGGGGGGTAMSAGGGSGGDNEECGDRGGGEAGGKPPQFCVAEEPAADAEGCLQLALRMPNGARLCRRFFMDGKVKDLLDFVGAQGLDMTKFKLAPGYPGGKDLDDETLSFSASGLVDKSLIVVKPKYS